MFKDSIFAMSNGDISFYLTVKIQLVRIDFRTEKKKIDQIYNHEKQKIMKRIQFVSD